MYRRKDVFQLAIGLDWNQDILSLQDVLLTNFSFLEDTILMIDEEYLSIEEILSYQNRTLALRVARGQMNSIAMPHVRGDQVVMMLPVSGGRAGLTFEFLATFGNLSSTYSYFDS